MDFVRNRVSGSVFVGVWEFRVSGFRVQLGVSGSGISGDSLFRAYGRSAFFT